MSVPTVEVLPLLSSPADRKTFTNSGNFGGVQRHVPVLLQETVEQLAIRADGVYVDCTVGQGGHSAAIADRLAAQGTLICIDADGAMLDSARRRLSGAKATVHFVHANYATLAELLDRLGIAGADGVLFDLGFCWAQVTDPSRGFSFQWSGPLDMRYDPAAGPSARELVGGLPRKALARVFAEFGGEKHAQRIAAAITEERAAKPIETTTHLAEVVRRAVPCSGHRRLHPATRVFQALRIAVNQEIESLRAGLDQSLNVLVAGGRGCAIAYHSLEHRAIKRFLRVNSGRCVCGKAPTCVCGAGKRLRVLTTEAIAPSDDEVFRNPQARSGRLRAWEKLEEPTQDD